MRMNSITQESSYTWCDFYDSLPSLSAEFPKRCLPGCVSITAVAFTVTSLHGNEMPICFQSLKQGCCCFCPFGIPQTDPPHKNREMDGIRCVWVLSFSRRGSDKTCVDCVGFLSTCRWLRSALPCLIFPQLCFIQISLYAVRATSTAFSLPLVTLDLKRLIVYIPITKCCFCETCAAHWRIFTPFETHCFSGQSYGFLCRIHLLSQALYIFIYLQLLI